MPNLIHPCQSGYVKGRFVGEIIRLIADAMHFTKEKNIPGVAVFLDFEKAFDSIERNFFINASKRLISVLTSDGG